MSIHVIFAHSVLVCYEAFITDSGLIAGLLLIKSSSAVCFSFSESSEFNLFN